MRNASRECDGAIDAHQTVSRYMCTLLTALEPSPTADATRFIDDKSHVARGEHARLAGLQQERRPLQRPARTVAL